MAVPQIFAWAPAVELQIDGAFSVSSAQFGDGYKQRSADGINNESQSGPLSFVGDGAKIAAILAFLRARKGSIAFYWTPPLGAQGLYTCEKYSVVSHGGGAYTLTATFEQTYSAGQ